MTSLLKVLFINCIRSEISPISSLLYAPLGTQPVLTHGIRFLIATYCNGKVLGFIIDRLSDKRIYFDCYFPFDEITQSVQYIDFIIIIFLNE